MQEKLVALTFDDGPNTVATPLVLDRIEKYGVVATFFINGKHVDSESIKVMKRALSLGCEYENHSYSHFNMDKLSKEEILDEIKRTDDLIIEHTGRKPIFFRPPFLSVQEVMFELIDHTFVGGFCPNDWDPNITSEMTAKGMLETAQEDYILLLHDSAHNSKTAYALDDIIPALLKQGYKFVTLSELFRKRCKTIDHSRIYYNVD